MAVAGLVLGIVSAVSGWFLPVIPIITGIIGIVLSVVGRKKLAEAGQPVGIATAGLVLSIIGTSLAVIGTICLLVCAAGAAAALGSGYW